ncbi:MAG: hypothetical protein IH825_03005, partial [Candidatus Marinimicrobia bacterium]|nr:hypothetical protein [Candidatus Neomarinimicrobiota bacterium]
ARWSPGAVTEMLEKAGAMDTRPDALEEGFGLVDGEYRLSAVQAQAILDLRLHRLTGLEQKKILNEYKDILEKIKVFSDILSDPDQLLEVINYRCGEGYRGPCDGKKFYRTSIAGGDPFKEFEAVDFRRSERGGVF